MRTKPQEVLIEIDSFQRDQESEERKITTYKGSRHEINDKIYVRYLEVLSEDDEPVSTMLVVDGNSLRIHRKGGYGGDMEFRPGKKTRLDYMTPMGKVPMVIDTSGLDLFISEHRIDIELKYNLCMTGDDGIYTQMRISITCPAVS